MSSLFLDLSQKLAGFFEVFLSLKTLYLSTMILCLSFIPRAVVVSEDNFVTPILCQ